MTGAPCLGCMSDAQPVSNGVATVNGFMNAVMLIALDVKQASLYLAAFCPRHGEIAGVAVAKMAEMNGLPMATLSAKIYETLGVPRPTSAPGTQSFTCPRCSATSHNENDIREGYCGRCHDWTRGPAA